MFSWTYGRWGGHAQQSRRKHLLPRAKLASEKLFRPHTRAAQAPKRRCSLGTVHVADFRMRPIGSSKALYASLQVHGECVVAETRDGPQSRSERKLIK